MELKYTEFEELIRNPKGALLELIKGSEELNFDSVTSAIAKVLKWTEDDIYSYFDVYSDIYKSYNGIRPRWMWDHVILACEIMRRNKVYSSTYIDYAYFELEEKWDKEREEAALSPL